MREGVSSEWSVVSGPFTAGTTLIARKGTKGRQAAKDLIPSSLFILLDLSTVGKDSYPYSPLIIILKGSDCSRCKPVPIPIHLSAVKLSASGGSASFSPYALLPKVCSNYTPLITHTSPIYNPYLYRDGLYMGYICFIYGLYMGYRRVRQGLGEGLHVKTQRRR